MPWHGTAKPTCHWHVLGIASLDSFGLLEHKCLAQDLPRPLHPDPPELHLLDLEPRGGGQSPHSLFAVAHSRKLIQLHLLGLAVRCLRQLARRLLGRQDQQPLLA
eukprot:CAMPEP_0177731894 /NCGR_PEP_ID=MMETSP0484_2-20121128/22805_1 /TAXON_ID=354590 /ORGANISM="Rhodomonas lens, Strain RHODO" /LENGTH=104 /DNA_ID=CAMNT_0019245059 /DNA_START=211 /DNA_END=525 /DNA_ORIENTATION=+